MIVIRKLNSIKLSWTAGLLICITLFTGCGQPLERDLSSSSETLDRQKEVTGSIDQSSEEDTDDGKNEDNEWGRVGGQHRRVVYATESKSIETRFPMNSSDTYHKIKMYVHPKSGPFIMTVKDESRVLFSQRVPIEPESKVWGDITLPIKAALTKNISIKIVPDTLGDTVKVTMPRAVWPKSSKRKQVIIISLDTLRADHLPVYGYKRNTAPVLTDFARNATVFEDALTNSPWTLPSHVTLMTGTDHNTHKVSEPKREMPAGIPTLASILGDNGYITTAITGSVWVTHYYLPYFQTHFEWRRPEIKGDLEFHRNRVLRWVETHKDDAYFLFYHIYTIHDPYEGTRFSKGLKKNSHADTVAKYDAGIYRADEMLGMLFQKLKETGSFDDALIIVLSDHGEELADRKREKPVYGHGHSLYQELIRIPLIIKFPGQKLQNTPYRVTEPAGLIDIMPTVLDIAGIISPAIIDGKSLKWASNENKNTEYKGRVFLLGAPNDLNYPLAGVRMDDYKVFREGILKNSKVISTDTSLYNLAKDPFEKSNLLNSPAHADTTRGASMMKIYWDNIQERTTRYTLKNRNIDLPPEERYRLKALGYLQ